MAVVRNMIICFITSSVAQHAEQDKARREEIQRWIDLHSKEASECFEGYEDARGAFQYEEAQEWYEDFIKQERELSKWSKALENFVSIDRTPLMKQLMQLPQQWEDITDFNDFCTFKENAWKLLDSMQPMFHPDRDQNESLEIKKWITDPENLPYEPEGRYVLDPKQPYVNARQFRSSTALFGLPTIHRHNSQFFEYSGKCHKPIADELIEGRVWTFLNNGILAPDAEPFKPTRSKVADTYSALKSHSQLSPDCVAPSWIDGKYDLDASEFIACKNGLLHVSTRTLYAHTPNYWDHFCVDYNFDLNAPSPEGWLVFINSIWPNDSEAIQLLQEWMGYVLSPDTSQQKILFLIGPRRSGKGTINRIINALMGNVNVCSPTLNSLAGQFGLQPLIGKRLASFNDVRLGHGADQKIITERLLTISGEDNLSVDRKHKSAWTGRLPTRIMLSSNELPRLNDASGALGSRFLILEMTNSYYGREDVGLFDRLVTELPGIFNWALEGADRLKQRGHFIEPASSAEAKEDLEDLSSMIGKFVREQCTLGPDLTISVDVLYNRWTVFCHGEGQSMASTKSTFGRDLKAAFPSTKKIRQRCAVTGLRINSYKGIQ